MKEEMDLAILDALMKNWDMEEEDSKGKKKSVAIIIDAKPKESESTEDDAETEEMDDDPFCEADIDTALPSSLKESLKKIAKKK